MHRGFVICVGIWHKTFSNAVTSRPGALPRLTQSVIILFRSALSVQGLLVYSIVRKSRVCEMFFIFLILYATTMKKKIRIQKHYFFNSIWIYNVANWIEHFNSLCVLFFFLLQKHLQTILLPFYEHVKHTILLKFLIKQIFYRY